MEWDFFENAEPQGSSDGFWYDIADGGYIDLDKLIKDPIQLDRAKEAVKTLQSLKSALEVAELLSEF